MRYKVFGDYSSVLYDPTNFGRRNHLKAEHPNILGKVQVSEVIQIQPNYKSAHSYPRHFHRSILSRIGASLPHAGTLSTIIQFLWNCAEADSMRDLTEVLTLQLDDLIRYLMHPESRKSRT